MNNVMAVVDLQYGSTGKGLIAGTIAHKWCPDTVVTAWGPNAGHTFRMGEQTWVHRMLANGAVAPSVTKILVGPGSVLDVERLAVEIKIAAPFLKGKHLIIHPQAAFLKPIHAQAEAMQLSKIGSTMKGTAEAVIEKMRRSKEAGSTVGHQRFFTYSALIEAAEEADLSLAISSVHYDRAVDNSDRLLIEGAQGFSLGIHTDFYPYTTARDVSTAQLLADCRVPLPRRWQVLRVVGVCRTYPIRVANREGSSGGCYPDQQEITWEDIGREPELTTVTRLPRRIFSFSPQQIKEAVRICQPSFLALTFCDYLPPPELEGFVDRLRDTAKTRVGLISHGPLMENVSIWDAMRNSPGPLPEAIATEDW